MSLPEPRRPRAAASAPGVVAVGGFAHGVGLLGRGFATWRRRPGLMLLGMVPALLVLVVLVAAFVGLVLVTPDLVGWATPFADDWSTTAREVLRGALVVALLAGAAFVSVLAFTGLTLAVGDPFYERIWAATERELGGEVPDAGAGWLKAARDGAVLVGYGLLASLLVLVVGLVPVVGPVVGLVLGVLISGRLLAAELVSRPLEARGLDGPARADLLRPHRSTVLGFGVATQLCFLVPLGGVLVMPAAVVASTHLAREVLDATGGGSATGAAPR